MNFQIKESTIQKQRYSNKTIYDLESYYHLSDKM